METMKGIQIAAFGGPEVLVMREFEKPQAKAGEVLIKLDYAGVSFADCRSRKFIFRPCVALSQLRGYAAIRS